jgi:hypothetical protein
MAASCGAFPERVLGLRSSAAIFSAGHVDAIPRIDEVDLAGWSADRQGSAVEEGRGRLRRPPTPVLAEIQVSGSADAITIEAHDTSVESGTYVGPLSRVVTRILQGYNFVLKNNNGSISVTVVGTPIFLAATPAPPGLPAATPEPGQSGAPAPAPVPGNLERRLRYRAARVLSVRTDPARIVSKS